MIAQALSIGAALALAGSPAQSGPSNPFEQDPVGPISNVTSKWKHYQPATTFCIKPDATTYTPGGNGATDTGADPVCRRSGFAPGATGLVKIRVETPRLCGGCRRLFIDFSKIPAANVPPLAYARGHAYYRLASLNPTYTVDPIAHSPNTKNFTNDKLVTPDGSPQQPFVAGFDLHAMEYVTDTAHFIHNASQGPYYIGPWYFNRAYHRVNGAYLDVDVVDAQRLPGGSMPNAISYQSGFNSGQACPSDDDLLYGGCVDWFGSSAEMLDQLMEG
jgi:hypothetical protein